MKNAFDLLFETFDPEQKALLIQLTTMHPIASVLQNINPEYDNIRFLARIVTQNCLPETHKFYRSHVAVPMIEYIPNSFAPNLKHCYDFLNGKFPSNCYLTNQIYGKDLPNDIIDIHKEFEEIRPMGRYIIVTYILKKQKNPNTKKDGQYTHQ